MKCPNCHNDVADSSLVCPICFTKVHDGSQNAFSQPSIQGNESVEPQVVVKQVVVKTVNTNKEQEVVHEAQGVSTQKEGKKVVRKKTDAFFLGVIIVGVVILIGLIIFLFFKNQDKEKVNTTKKTIPTTVDATPLTNNKGYRSTFNYPLSIGEVTLANVHDKETGIDTQVDVKGIRFIEGSELLELATLYSTENLNVEFEWVGFEYEVSFNDLEYLGDRTISPVLNAKVYKWNGCDFVNYNGKNYILNVKSIYDGPNIKNNQSATIKVLFQMPMGYSEYSICFGDYNKTMGCFSK